MLTALCKFRGMLVIAEIVIRKDGVRGACPECSGTEFRERNGWTECDCGFAYLTADIRHWTNPEPPVDSEDVCVGCHQPLRRGELGGFKTETEVWHDSCWYLASQ